MYLSQVAAPTELEVELLAEPENVHVARHAAVDFVRGAAVDENAIALCISEVVSNVVLHAYEPGEPGPMRLTGRFDADRRCVEFVVRDRGRGLRRRPGAITSGFGLPIVGALATGLELKATDGGTQTRLWFHVR